MPDIVYVNGEFLPVSKAKVSVFDRGFLYGDGFFETMRAYHSKIFLLTEHLDRLYGAAEAMEMVMPWTGKELENLLNEIVRLNGQDLYIRLTVTRGVGPPGIDPESCQTPSLLITAREIKYNERIYQKGAKAVFVQTLRNLAGAVKPEVKSLNFLNNIFARQEVNRARADEGFMLNYQGQVTEGTVSNAFMVKNGIVYTPHLDSGLLPGITRSNVIKLAAEEDLEVREQFLYYADFLKAEEVFYTNSTSEIVPVCSLDNRTVGFGQPGMITFKLLNRYRKKVLEQCQPKNP